MSNSVTDIDRKMKLLDSEFKLSQEQMKSYADETTKAELEVQRLSEKIALQTQKVNLNKTALDNVGKSNELTEKQLDSVRKKYIDSEKSLSVMNNALEEAKKKLENSTKSTKDYSDKLSSLDSNMKLIDSELRLNVERLKDSDDENKRLTTTIDALTKKIEIQAQKLDITKIAYDKANNSGNATESQLNGLKQQYIENEVQLIKMNNALSEAKGKLDDIKSPADNVEKSFKKNSNSAADMAGKLYILNEALKRAKEALTSYVDFDVSMSKVKTIADTTVVSFDNLKQGVYEIAKQTGQSAVSIAEALNQCISSNVETADSLNVTLAAAKLAKAGFTDTATSVDVLTTIMNSYGISAKYVTLISDKLIETQDKGKTTVGELGASFGKVAGLAQQAGISLDEVLAAVSTLTLTNGSASESLTSLKAAISNIIKPTAEAREIADKLHIQFNATTLSSKGLAEFLEMVNQKCRGNTETMAKLFGSTEALNAMLLLTGSGAESFSTNLQSISDSGGKTEENLKNLNSTGDRFKKSIENMKTKLVELGDTLSPVLEVLSAVFTVLSNIPAPIYAIIAVISIMLIVMKNWATITTTLTLIQTGFKFAIGGIATMLGIKTAAQTASTAADLAATGANAALAGATSAAAGANATLAGASTAAAGANTALAGATTAAAGASAALGASGAIATSGLAPLLILILAIVVAIGILKGVMKSVSSIFNETKTSATELMNTSKEVGTSLQGASQKSGLLKNNASGTRYYSGGRTVVGEEGPEIIDPPVGSRIYNARESQSIMSGDNYNVYVNVRANEIQEVQDFINIIRGQRMAARRL